MAGQPDLQSVEDFFLGDVLSVYFKKRLTDSFVAYIMADQKTINYGYKICFAFMII